MDFNRRRNHLPILLPERLAPALSFPLGSESPSHNISRSLLFMSQDREEVDVTRRRETEGGDRGRAEAPSRQRDRGGSSGGGGGGGLPPFGGGGYSGGPSSGSNLPIGDIIALLLRLPPPVLVGLLLLACCAGVAFFMFGGGSALPTTLPAEPTSFVADNNPTVPPPDLTGPTPAVAAPASPTRAANAPTVSAAGQRWLVMLYQDATDRVLDQDIFTDLNEAERAGSTDRVRIVSQIDRYKSAQNARDWSTAKRLLVTRDPDLHTVRSQQLADLGQVNMADPQTLIDFATWAIKTYPADKYVLVMSDHGMGWPGGFSDPAVNSIPSSGRSIPLVSRIGNLLYLNDLDKALGTIRSQAGIKQFELIGLDACLMSQMEVISALSPHARYAVASEETEPALGWAYTAFLDTLNANPDMSGADLARSIVQTYINDDQRIVDDQARAELAGRGSPLSGLLGGGAVPSADQVAQQMGADVTLTALDLQSYAALLQSVNNLAFSLQSADSRTVAQARSYSQSFTSIFGQSAPPSYIDLGNWVQHLAQSASAGAVADASQQVLAAIKSTVIAEKHGPDKPGATGLSIYFPTSELYQNPAAGPQSYTAIANRWASDSLWDDYLAYFYTGKRFQQTGTVAVPSRGENITAPAAGGIQVSALKLSARTAAPGRPVTLSLDVDGKNVGHVRLFVGYYDSAANSINVADDDYLQSSQSRQVGGVFYPVWPASGRFTVKFSWDPIVFAIDDGRQQVPALFVPSSYGATQAQAEYYVDGTYNFADKSPARRARLLFRDKVLRQVLGFTNGDAGSPWEITPSAGDTFTVDEKWIDLDAQGNAGQTVTQKGGTVTFGNAPLRWRDLDAAAGEYRVGFVVEDLDGNQTPVFDRVTVQ